MRPARPIQGKGRMARIQSAKDGMKPRSSLTCCSPTQRVGITLPVESVSVRPKIVSSRKMTLCVMPEGPMTKIAGDRLRLVEPAVQRQIVEG